MIELTLALLLILGFIVLTGGTGQKRKTHPPPDIKPTDRDLVVEEMVLERFGGAISSMTPAGRSHFIEQIKQLQPRDKSIK
jgi:hypothetical protein